VTSGKKRTESELLFERYLGERRLTDFEFEPALEGVSRSPDYRLCIGPHELFFEIKEFDVGEKPRSPWPDPTKRIREKINEAQPQLRPLKGRMCALVLADPKRTLIPLDEETVYEAMLGDLAAIVPVEPDDNDSPAPLGRMPSGKMLRYDRGEPIGTQNTTIGAICVLGFAPRVTPTEQVGLRLAVYDNPYTIAPLLQTFPTGPFDERYGPRGDCLVRTFLGEGFLAEM